MQMVIPTLFRQPRLGFMVHFYGLSGNSQEHLGSSPR
jgi:hypothetical protein